MSDLTATDVDVILRDLYGSGILDCVHLYPAADGGPLWEVEVTGDTEWLRTHAVRCGVSRQKHKTPRWEITAHTLAEVLTRTCNAYGLDPSRVALSAETNRKGVLYDEENAR